MSNTESIQQEQSEFIKELLADLDNNVANETARRVSVNRANRAKRINSPTTSNDDGPVHVGYLGAGCAKDGTPNHLSRGFKIPR